MGRLESDQSDLSDVCELPCCGRRKAAVLASGFMQGVAHKAMASRRGGDGGDGAGVRVRVHARAHIHGPRQPTTDTRHIHSYLRVVFTYALAHATHTAAHATPTLTSVSKIKSEGHNMIVIYANMGTQYRQNKRECHTRF
jgi:hypothetical protein